MFIVKINVVNVVYNLIKFCGLACIQNSLICSLTHFNCENRGYMTYFSCTRLTNTVLKLKSELKFYCGSKANIGVKYH